LDDCNHITLNSLSNFESCHLLCQWCLYGMIDVDHTFLRHIYDNVTLTNIVQGLHTSINISYERFVSWAIFYIPETNVFGLGVRHRQPGYKCIEVASTHIIFR